MVLLSPLCGNMHVLTLNTCGGRSSRVSKCLSCIFCRKRVCGVACSLDYPFTVCVMLIHSPIDDWQDAYHYYLQSGLFKRIVLNREIRARFICFCWVRYLVFLFESKSLSPLTYFTGGGTSVLIIGMIYMLSIYVYLVIKITSRRVSNLL